MSRARETRPPLRVVTPARARAHEDAMLLLEMVEALESFLRHYGAPLPEELFNRASAGLKAVTAALLPVGQALGAGARPQAEKR